MTAQTQALLRHAEWIRALARQLVGDPEVADDLAQDTWVAALRRPETPIRSERAWLAGVLRKLVVDRLRRDARRDRRERAAARVDSERESSAADVVERAAVHREVVDAVIALPEHYREIVLLRYFDGMSPTRIASELDMPVSSVKTRLQRGLARLREHLDERHGGDGRAWLAALAPLVHGPSGAGIGGETSPSLGAGGSAGAWIVAASVALGLLGAGALVWSFLDSARPRPQGYAAATTAAVGARSLDGGDAAESALLGTRTTDVPGAESIGVSTFADDVFDPRRRPVRGAIVDVDDQPVAGLVVTFEPRASTWSEPSGRRGTAVAVSGADGAFELRSVRGLGRLTIANRDYVVLLAPDLLSGDDGEDVTLVVARARSVDGRVVDVHGRPVSDALIEVALPDGLRAGSRRGLDRAATRSIAVLSDASGRFELPGVPRFESRSVQLIVTRDGFASLTHDVDPATTPGSSSRGVELTLARTRPPEHTAIVRGVVVGADGGVVADARVALAGRTTRADAEGAFWLPSPAAAAELVAVADGHGPVVVPLDRTAQREIVVRLPAAPATIRGRVHDAAAGEALALATVWIADPTPFGRPASRRPADATHGIGDRVSVERRRVALDVVDRRRLPSIVETVVGRSGAPSPWHCVRTDADGTFELGGLVPGRTYTVVAMAPGDGPVARLEGVRAGAADVELVVDVAALRTLTGRVVDTLGEPVAGVKVRGLRCLFALDVRGRVLHRELDLTGAVQTGRDGTFALRGIPRGPCWLRVAGRAVMTTTSPWPASAGAHDVVVPRRVRFRVVDVVDRATAVEVVDADGGRLPLQRFHGNRRAESERVPVENGATEWFWVAAARATRVRVVDRDGELVAAIPVDSRSGGELRP